MQIPLSWLKEMVDIDIPVELLAEKLTVAGLEVSHLQYIGVPQQTVAGIRSMKSDHLVWDREKLLLGAVREVKPHPDADRLVLAMVDYGGAELEQCVTGAPNLFQYKGQGELNPPVWTAFAAEGAEVWDGHSDEPKRMILKGKPLRGVFNKSMVCSEKELGMSGEHEGIILLHDQPRAADGKPFPAGTPLQDVLGDVVLEVELTPNLARCYSVLGVAREIAALLDKDLREPSYNVVMEGAPIDGQASIEIRTPELNQRFTLTLLCDAEIKPSPEWMQRRLQLCGQRPINNIVDVTNYITFEIGQPLHAYDYDKLVARAGGKAPTLITRLPKPGETLETLDQVNRQLYDQNILVCDTVGVLGLGGVIGGAETEISNETKNVLLEAANWNFINIRRTMQQQKVFTDAGVRYSRGVHPSQAILGVKRGIELMRQGSGGKVAQGVIDVYPLQPETIQLDLPASEVRRLTGMDITTEIAADILTRLQFDVTIEGEVLHVTVPDHRMDISSDTVIGQADLIEEIVRVLGYDAIPMTIMDDAMPEQWANVALETEETTRDLLITLGLRENITYRFSTPEAEALLNPSGQAVANGREYVMIANPIAPEKSALRQTLLPNLLEVTRANLRYQRMVQTFEIGSVYYYPTEEETPEDLPLEPRHLSIVLTGQRDVTGWLNQDSAALDFYDLKGIVEGLVKGLHVGEVTYTRAENVPHLHPGRSAELHVNGKSIGVFGELHPIVARNFDLELAPVLVAEFDLDTLLNQTEPMYRVQSLPITPAILEDIALVVKDQVNAAEVEAIIRQAGGDLLKSVTLFDVYRGAPVPEGHKSLAYSLTYQTDDRTLNDKEVAAIRKKIIKSAEARLGATLRA
ncbi:MAG TPA: phenylalanine--tRNA ligase subunit beta [Phototrophicaceae bacterium]|jgi:phenylalanyl-tRNA synthetase beta chain|nr:phenylalanine--tRNA ligase subunit beta [Phototrophicaceae bacterium]